MRSWMARVVTAAGLLSAAALAIALPTDRWMARTPWLPLVAAYGALLTIVVRSPSPWFWLIWFWMPASVSLGAFIGESTAGALLLTSLAVAAVWLRVAPPRLEARFAFARGFRIAIAVAIAMKLYVIVFHGLRFGPNDIGTSTLDAARFLLAGRNPYLVPEATANLNAQQNFMYPPLAILPYLPLANATTGYGTVFVTNLALDLVGAWFFWRIAVRLHGDVVARTLVLLYLANPLTAGQLYANGVNDGMPAVLALVGIDMFLARRERTALGALAAGTAAKWFPGIVVAGAAKVLLAERRPRALLVWAIVPLIVFAIILAPFAVEDWREVRHDLTWTSIRPLERWERFTSVYSRAHVGYSLPVHAGVMLAAWLAWPIRSRGGFVRGWLVATIAFALFSRSVHMNYLLWFHGALFLGVVSDRSEVPLAPTQGVETSSMTSTS